MNRKSFFKSLLGISGIGAVLGLSNMVNFIYKDNSCKDYKENKPQFKKNKLRLLYNKDVIRMMSDNYVCILVDLFDKGQDNWSERLDGYQRMIIDNNYNGIIAPKIYPNQNKENWFFETMDEKEQKILKLAYAS